MSVALTGNDLTFAQLHAVVWSMKPWNLRRMPLLA